MRNRTWLGYLLIPAAALATVALAQGTAPDAPPAIPEVTGPVDAGALLGDRARPPDQRADADAPDGIQQGENAGSLRMQVPVEERSSTTTVTEETSSGVTFGSSAPPAGWRAPVPGEIAGNPPPPPGWPGSRRANRPVQSGWGDVATLDAGPIWNNEDAQGKCARTCGNANMGWTGEWRTVGPNRSVCDCAVGGRHGWAGGGGRGSSCFAPANHQCQGCSISCPAGHAARCTQGDRGIFTGERDAICAKDAKCECI